MTKQESIKFLNEMLQMIQNMTQEEFNQREKELGLDKIIYATEKYVSKDIEIVLFNEEFGLL